MFDVTGGDQGRRNVFGCFFFAAVHEIQVAIFCHCVWLISVCYHLGKGTTDLHDLAVPSDLKRFVTNITIQITCRHAHKILLLLWPFSLFLISGKGV